MTDTFYRDLLGSILGHVVLVALILFEAVLIPSQPLELRQAMRVDIVGLPDKIQQPIAKPAQPKPVVKLPAPKTKAPPKVSEKKISQREQEALNRLKAEDAVEKIEHELKEKNAAKANPTQYKGNEVMKGNSLTGLARLDYDQYVDQIQTQIESHWQIPQWLADADLKAQVLVLIDERGYVTKKQLVKSSGNDIFDANALGAVAKSSPFPPPPERLRALLSTSGIIFKFPQ